MLCARALYRYGARRADTDPHTDLAHSLHDLYGTWLDHPADRAELDHVMTDHPATVVGHHPTAIAVVIGCPNAIRS